MRTLKNIGFGILLLICSIGFSQEEEIPWSASRKLVWTDFKGAPQNNSDAAATTASGISYGFSAQMDSRGNTVVDYEVNAFFYPNESWYKPSLSSDLILSHEQLHFDIAELFARKMRAQLSKMTFSKNVKKEIRQVYQSTIKALQAYQREYDRATNFSRNREQQLLWVEKINKALQ
ncbi:DUF922 domain-containing protein [Spongiimicrobium salis]|uniref:DUF922 domain-containing protein n=1 Tax=Spongiimicrobium salis TaxID=1667022 RepID=UPI00374CAD4B